MQASEQTRKAFFGIISCYSRKATTGKIILLSKEESVPVEWGHYSMLKANLRVYRKLLELNEVNN